MSELHDRLNELAQRGTPRGFDSVLDAAAREAERTSADRIAAVPDLDADRDDGDLDTIPFVTTEPIRRRRRPLGSMIAAAGVAALLLVGTFAVSALVGSGGGSGSAEGAVRRLADALSHEDPLAAADVLAPSEVRSLRGTVDAAARKAKELELVQTAGAPLAGVDFDVSGLKLSTQSLGNGYERVTVDRGTFSASTHKAQFSPLMQQILRTSDDKSAQSDLARLAAKENLPTFVVVVREEGRWYVSTAYTVLEYVREVNQLPAADFGSGVHNVSTLGADTPDAAVQDSMRALQAEDWSKLMTMVSPREIPFYDYRAAFTELIRQSRSGDTTPPAPVFTIGSMRTTSDVSGATAKVSLTASGRTKHGTWSLDGGCFKAGSDDATNPQFQYPVTCGAGSSLAYFSVLALPFTGADSSSQFTVVRQDGRWFVSPVGTVLDVIDHTISQLDRRAVYSMLNIPGRIPFDGALTLGRPVALSVSPAKRGLQVLSFEGHQGEQLLGLATSTATSGSKSKGSGYAEIPADVRVFAPDGSEIADAGNLLSGHALTLPADGAYKFVLQMHIFSFDTLGDVTVTIWDAANAPAEAKTDRGTSSCSYTLLGSSCNSGYSSGGPLVGPTPTAVATNPAERCTSTATETVCSGTSGSLGLPATGPRSGPNSTAAGGVTIIGGGIGVSGSGTGTSVLVTPSTVAGGGGGNSRSSSATSSLPHG
ncbi:MAG: hypothetical protein QOE62_1235 [Actinomycetota bacterium]|nr:hypothetical protein [Actinomycetota bacterium]